MKISKFGVQLQKIEEGFTLLEILVAVFISTLILGVLYTSFFQILKAKEKVEDELELLHESRVIFSRLNRDLSNIFPRGKVFEGSRDYAYPYFLGTLEGESSRLQFSSFVGSPIHFTRESDQSEITYYLDDLEDDSGLYYLVRRDNPWFGNNEGGTEYPISDRVVKFKLRYMDKSDVNKITEEYDEEWNAALLDILPRAVEVEVVLRSESEGDLTYKTTILIPISS